VASTCCLPDRSTRFQAIASPSRSPSSSSLVSPPRSRSPADVADKDSIGNAQGHGYAYRPVAWCLPFRGPRLDHRGVLRDGRTVRERGGRYPAVNFTHESFRGPISRPRGTSSLRVGILTTGARHRMSVAPLFSLATRARRPSIRVPAAAGRSVLPAARCEKCHEPGRRRGSLTVRTRPVTMDLGGVG
jgi:hypothetical protein